MNGFQHKDLGDTPLEVSIYMNGFQHMVSY